MIRRWSLRPHREGRAALLCAVLAMAVGPALGVELSLDTCVQRALRASEESRRADAELRSARARYLEARAAVLPHLELSGSYTKQLESIYSGTGEGSSFSADTTASLEARVRALEDALPGAGYEALGQLFSSSVFASRHAWEGSLALSQKLYQGGFLWHSIAAASQALRSAALARADADAEIVLRAREAYLAALLAERELEIARLSLAQIESGLARIRLRKETGDVSEFELLRAEVERDNHLPGVQQALNSRELALLDLARVVNLPPAEPIVLTTPLLDPGAPGQDAADVDTTGLVAAALDAPAIRALEQFAGARRHAVAIAGSRRWPEISAFGSLSQQAYPREMWPARDDFRRDARVGLRVQWSLFDGLETRGALEEARAARSRAEVDLADGRERVRQAVVQTRGELVRAAADLAGRTRTAGLARRALELAELRYQEGTSSLIDVEDARRDLEMAEDHEARARHDYFVALARLERHTGRSLFGDRVGLGGKP